MKGYLGKLIERTLRPADLVQPRPQTLFAPLRLVPFGAYHDAVLESGSEAVDASEHSIAAPTLERFAEPLAPRGRDVRRLPIEVRRATKSFAADVEDPARLTVRTDTELSRDQTRPVLVDARDTASTRAVLDALRSTQEKLQRENRRSKADRPPRISPHQPDERVTQTSKKSPVCSSLSPLAPTQNDIARIEAREETAVVVPQRGAGQITPSPLRAAVETRPSASASQAALRDADTDRSLRDPPAKIPRGVKPPHPDRAPTPIRPALTARPPVKEASAPSVSVVPATSGRAWPGATGDAQRLGTVHISIGRLEIRANPAPSTARAKSPAESRPRLGLQEYLRRRGGGRQ